MHLAKPVTGRISTLELSKAYQVINRWCPGFESCQKLRVVFGIAGRIAEGYLVAVMGSGDCAGQDQVVGKRSGCAGWEGTAT